MPKTGTLPHRLVDREHRSWILTRGPDGREVYTDVYTAGWDAL